MPRGFVWSIYVDDTAQTWRVQVDADYALEVERGWVPADPSAVAPFPRTWLTRKVLGVDESGRRRSTPVATEDADLWTGAVGFWTISGNDGLPYPVTVIGRLAERRR